MELKRVSVGQFAVESLGLRLQIVETFQGESQRWGLLVQTGDCPGGIGVSLQASFVRDDSGDGDGEKQAERGTVPGGTRSDRYSTS